MKIKRIIIFLLLIILGMPSSVSAKEVDAKYQYVSDNSVYSKKITDKKTIIELENISIQVKDTKEKNQGKNIKIISVAEDSQLSWLNKSIKNNALIKAYYFIFEDSNNNQVDLDDIKVSLNNNLNNYTIYTVNNAGMVIDSSNNNKQEIKLLNNNYFVIVQNSNTKKINYQANPGGSIVLDGQIISESGEYNFESNIIIIRTNSGYELQAVTLNGKNILNEINNGFLDVSQEENLTLNIKYVEIIEQTVNDSYDFLGQVIYNGKPLSNAYIELHSDTLITTTDELGNFYFKNISLGKHSITISHDNKVIGYSEFAINQKEDKSVELVYKNNERITSNLNKVDLTLYINDNYDVTIENKGEVLNNNEKIIKNNGYLIFFSVILIILLIIYLIYRNTKNKEK